MRRCAMSDVGIRVQNCIIAFGHLGYRSDLEAVSRSGIIVLYLPSQPQSRWEEEAEAISRGDCEANLEELADYLDWGRE